MTDAIDGLIEKLEAAEGPSRELDAEIAVIFNPNGIKLGGGTYLKMPTPYDEVAAGHYWLVSRSGMSLHGAPKFTESIDDAMTLISEGLSYEFRCSPYGESSQASIWDGRKSPQVSELARVSINGVRPAIALCIAALKALRARKGGAP